MNTSSYMDPKSIKCGLDFGTSNTVITLSETQNKEKLFSYKDSSILYFPISKNLEYYIGKEAILKYVENNMQGRLLKSVKTLLKQKSFKFTWINGKKMTVEMLVSFVLKHFKEKAEKELEISLDEVILGRPAKFSEDLEAEKIAEERLMNAAKLAGFKNIFVQLEPIAALLSFEQNLSSNKVVLVADLGGGTTDFSVMKLEPNSKKSDRKSDILASGGVYIGGDLFDSEIMWDKITPHLGRNVKYESFGNYILVPNRLHIELRNWERSFLLKGSKLRRAMEECYVFSGKNQLLKNLFTLIDKNLTYSLFQHIENSKIELSSLEKSKISFSQNTISIFENINLLEFETLIEKHIKKIQEYLEDLLKSNNLQKESIDVVFLTGGTSDVRSIRALFRELFNDEKLKSGDNFNSVSYGLSISTF